MSDIAIRLDGLVLLLSLGVGAILYGLIAIGGGLVVLFHPAGRKRAWRVTRAAFAMTLGTGLAGYLFFDYWVDSDVAWVDWLTVPWVFLFAVGCWGLIKV